MRRSSLSFLTGALLVAAPAAASAQTQTSVVRETVPYDFPDFNECNGETVQLTGVLETTVRRKVQPDGRTNFVYNLVPHLEGIGSFGNKYNVLGGERSHEQFIEGNE